MIKLIKQNCFGQTKYVDTTNNIEAYKQDDKWMFTKNGKLKFNAGFVNISCVEQILNNEPIYEECLNMVGFFRTDPTKFEFELNMPEANAELYINQDGQFVLNFYLSIQNTYKEYNIETNDFDRLIQFILSIEDKIEISLDGEYDYRPVIAASSRDFAKNKLVRVKSSNMWAIGLDIKKHGDKTGTLYVQFKDKNGGPGDVYQYIECPIKVYNRMVGAPSKGHFFWKHIRDNLRYRKLTGDKKGKLPNAIN